MQTRRQVLASLLAALGSAAAGGRESARVFADIPATLPTTTASANDVAGSTQVAPRAIPWRNWSGSQQCLPAARLAPKTIAELQQLVADATGTVRAVGAGHSFSPLVPTDGTLVSLARLSGMVDHDPEHLTGTFLAGTPLGNIGAPLEAVGQAMINLPDIDEQSLAGCMATATHGTGAAIGCLPTFIEELELVTANGDLLVCNADRNPDIFRAAQVSLGCLGIITKVRLRNRSPYRLKREIAWRPIDEIIDGAEQLVEDNRNFEFFYIPFTGMGWTDLGNITTEPLGTTPRIDSNEGARDLKRARDLLGWSPTLRRWVLSTYINTLNDEVVVEPSWRNYATERNVRFNEMEYHLPRESGLAALREIRTVLESSFEDVFLPIEFRYVAADNIWLSPFHGRESCSIAVHRYFEENFQPWFAAVEPILRKHGGRPHWGKINTLQRADFAALYPRWNDFIELRRQLDPGGRFLSPYLQTLLG